MNRNRNRKLKKFSRKNEKNQNEFKIPNLNNNYLINQYQKIVDSSNLEGKVQISIGWLLMLLYITSNFIFILFSISKEYPKYYCISYEDFEDEISYDSTIYKIIKRCNTKKALECLQKFCLNPTYKNDEGIIFNNRINVEESFYEKTKIPQPKIILPKINDQESSHNYYIIDFNQLPAILHNSTSIKNFISEFFQKENFCEIEIYSTEVLRLKIMGKIIGTIIFYFITKFLGRK